MNAVERWTLYFCAVVTTLVLYGSLMGCAPSPPPAPVDPVAVPGARPVVYQQGVPAEAQRWRNTLTRNARMVWGIDAPIADFAAQIEQESAWTADARSRTGALGLGQFMPATATWLAGAYSSVGPADPENPTWALRALVTYDDHLNRRMSASDPCNRLAKALAAYNGGEVGVHRAEAIAVNQKRSPDAWFGTLDSINPGKSEGNFRENSTYPARILNRISPRYQHAWSERSQCGTGFV